MLYNHSMTLRFFIANRADRPSRGWLGLARGFGHGSTCSLVAATRNLSLRHLVLVLVLLGSLGGAARAQVSPAPATNVVLKAAPEGFAGSRSCRECHAKFYELWSTSFHGLAMQPYTPELAKTKLTPQNERSRRRQVPVPRRHPEGAGHRARSRRREAIPHRAGHGRQERLLFPDARWSAAGCRCCPWPTMSAARNGSTPRPAPCAISATAATRRSTGRNGR